MKSDEIAVLVKAAFLEGVQFGIEEACRPQSTPAGQSIDPTPADHLWEDSDAAAEVASILAPRPSRLFLQKVARGRIYQIRTADQHGKEAVRLVGGELTVQRHVEGGYVTVNPARAPWERVPVTLTDRGKAVIGSAQ